MMIKCIKLNNGEEVIGRVVGSPSSDSIVLEHPVTLRIMNIQGEPRPVMLPFSEANHGGSFTFRAHAWTCDPYDASHQVEQAYIQNTTGIALA